MNMSENSHSLEAELTTGVAVSSALPAGGEEGQILTWTQDGAAWQAFPAATQAQAGAVRVGDGLCMTGGALCVDTADAVTAQDDRPVRASTVHALLGDVEALLSQI